MTRAVVQAASDLIADAVSTPAVQAVARLLEKGGVLSSCGGLTPSSHAYLAATLRRLFPQSPILIVCESLRAQEIMHQDVGTWLRLDRLVPEASSNQAVFYPAWEVLPHEDRLPHADVISERLETLIRLKHMANAAAAPALTIVASVASLLQRTFPPAEIASRTRTLNRSERVNPLDLVEWLEDQGYEPEAQVTQKGEIALRGGIVDIFAPTNPWPVRLEFFGDELESLREFDPATQMSREEITSTILPPAGELGLLKRELKSAAAAGQHPSELATLLDYLPPETIILVSDGELVDERAREYESQLAVDDAFHIAWDLFKQRAVAQGCRCVELHEDTGSATGQGTIEEQVAIAEASSQAQSVSGLEQPASCPQFESLEAFRPLAERPPEPHIAEAQRREFFAQLHRWLRQDYRVHVFCNNDGERQRFIEVWREYGLSGGESSPELLPTLHLASVSRGFLYHEGKLVVVTDAEIFGRYRVQRARRLKSPHAQATRSALDIDFTDLDDGDYVVHLQHGIGRYAGLTVLPVGSGKKPAEHAAAAPAEGVECLVIEYAPSDPAQPAPKLYVPITEAHLVSKYVGTGKARPPLNTLGGTKWAKAKAQAERAVRDIASELLMIQAARDSQPGYAFEQDAPWQREFEGAFIFEETPDQLRAIQETKQDMERAKPMDRLICGDVGFGKTEVAIRAAFKAVMGGKQVAVLVPTTVLAQQHYNTFRERMADYPVRVELLSRFRTRGQQQRAIRDLAAGSVDIIVGTHRLIQGDVEFKDLGLVIVDEEQRFGVMHKEKFKMLRRLVDVLTLSATPIPRTLYLALSGARDMSTIQTPPHDRLPVETVVTQYDERLIRDAVQRELNRGGQVFFLHNRVATIQVMAQKLASLVPQARIVVGHGQMHSDELEEVMTAFINGEADVLLSTTIIESGLDIPNANTIIIDRADRFGLSDLYQLRGRVGRYKHQAYAYLLLPRHARLLTDVRKRMSAIKQYSTLGSGFKIAMRDLEIRGAGNLLGAEQSGYITAVGFDLYCQLLKQSIASMKGEKIKPRLNVQVRLDFLTLNPIGIPGIDPDLEPEAQPAVPLPANVGAAYVPMHYVSDPRQRIEIYRKLAELSDKADLVRLEKEVRDRFGKLPPEMQLLLQVAELKVLAGEKSVSVLEVKEDKLMLTRNDDFVMVGNRFPRLTKKTPEARLKEIKKLLLALAPDAAMPKKGQSKPPGAAHV